MHNFSIKFKGIKELQAAIGRNPNKTKQEISLFLMRAISKYKSGIINNPWRMGSSGGGAPVSSGNLRDTHQTEIKPLQARIYPTAKYAPYVHGIEGYPRKRSYQLRPWLDYVKQQKEVEVKKLQDQMLQNIVSDLVK